MNSLGKDAHNTFYLMAILLKTTKLMPLKLRPNGAIQIGLLLLYNNYY